MILARADSLSGSSVIRFDGKTWFIGSIICGERHNTIDLHVRQRSDDSEWVGEWVWATLNRRDLVEVLPRKRQ